MAVEFGRIAELRIQHAVGGTDVLDGFRIEFEITLTETVDADVSRITVYNLNPGRIAEFAAGDRVVLNTGYATSSLQLLHTSRIDRVENLEDGVTNRVRITVTEIDLHTAVINESRRGVYPIQRAARDVCRIAGVPADTQELEAAVPITFGINNWSASGRGSDVINDLLTPVGAKCKVVGGVARFFRDGRPDPLNRAFQVSQRTGLIGSPIEADNGVRVQVVLNNQMEPGIHIDLESRHTTGRFKVLKVVHRGDTGAGGDWLSELTCAVR